MLSRVQLFVTPWPATCQAPLSMGFFQARIVEWVAISSSKGSSPSRDWTHVPCISYMGRWILYLLSHWGSPHNIRPGTALTVLVLLIQETFIQWLDHAVEVAYRNRVSKTKIGIIVIHMCILLSHCNILLTTLIELSGGKNLLSGLF